MGPAASNGRGNVEIMRKVLQHLTHIRSIATQTPRTKAPMLTCLKYVKENHKKVLATSHSYGDNGVCRKTSLRSSSECRRENTAM